MNTVEPIKDAKKLQEIFEGLENDHTTHGERMYLLFATMFYTGLRVCDIVKLQKRQVTGQAIIIREQKTGKEQRIEIAPDLRAIYDARLFGVANDAYLFQSRKRRPDGTSRHITTREAGYDMKIIKKRFSLNIPFACHSVRKTHGYIRYTVNHEPIEAIRQHLNHADEKTTRRYIGIDQEELNKGLRKLSAGNYKPPRPEHPTRRKADGSEVLEITRQDREENGRKYGKIKQEARAKAELKKQNKKAYDAKRYRIKKEAEEAAKAQSEGEQGAAFH